MRLLPGGVLLGAVVVLLLVASPVSSHNPVTTTVVFNREVAAVLNQKCAQCHAPDAMAMPLQSYADVRPWAVAIKEEILARRMPPWPAERGYGAFANDVSLTLREQEFLISWIDGGVPPGAGEPPPHVDHSGHWMLGQPDGLYAARAADAPAPGSRYLRYTVDPGLRKDTWVRAIDVKPADKRALRAAFLTVARTGQYLGGWTPWSTSTQLPEGTAFKLAAGSTIVIDALAGAAAPQEPPSLGLYFTDKPARTMATLTLAATRAATGGRVHVESKLAADQSVIALRAEMSAGGTSLEVRAMRPDGSVEPLLWIKEFRHDWQTPYVLRSPVSLPRGTVLKATALFDDAAVAPRVEVDVNIAAMTR